jgi:hypothetical protein
MKRNPVLKVAACLAALVSLGSCSIGYDVDVALREGKVMFAFSRSGWFSRENGAQVQGIFVRELSRVPHLVWQVQSIDYNGRAIGDLAYGAVPSGMKQEVVPQPLKIGQYYRVELLALGGGGYKEFIISPEPSNGQRNEVQVVRP